MSENKIELIRKAITKYESKIASVIVTRDDFDTAIKNERIIEKISDDIYICDTGLLYTVRVRAVDIVELKALRKIDFIDL